MAAGMGGTAQTLLQQEPESSECGRPSPIFQVIYCAPRGPERSCQTISCKVDMKCTLAISLSGAIMLLCILSFPVLGQYGTGTILGTVSDPIGSVIPAVKVTVKNEATNESRDFVTDAEGFYRSSALQNGRYTITAAAPSFRTATIANLTLTVNSEARADIVMQVGNVTEQVEVQATTPQLQTNSAAMGSVIDNRTMLEL